MAQVALVSAAVGGLLTLGIQLMMHRRHDRAAEPSPPSAPQQRQRTKFSERTIAILSLAATALALPPAYLALMSGPAASNSAGSPGYIPPQMTFSDGRVLFWYVPDGVQSADISGLAFTPSGKLVVAFSPDVNLK